MTSLARIRPSLRRAAFVAALGALMVPATAGAAVHAEASAKKKKKAKLPVVTSVRPMKVEIGQTLEIRGKHFLRGRNKNSVVFKRDGGKAVFVKAGIGTTKLLRVKLPVRLGKQLRVRAASPVPTRFRVRVLTKKLGKRFTKKSRSPVISAASSLLPPASAAADGDCDTDGVLNRNETDDDNDLLSDDVENDINRVLAARYPVEPPQIDPCEIDTDDDGVEDGFEYRSARDLNDDEYQNPNTYLPYPAKKPYPNPLFNDAGTDYDGDSLTLIEEQKLWILASKRPGHVRSLDSLYYSDGMQYSIHSRGGANNRRQPDLRAVGYDQQIAFESWLRSSGYEFVEIPGADGGHYALLDSNRDGDVSTTTEDGQLHSERYYLNTTPGLWLSDDERDEDADGLSNYEESSGRTMAGSWWNKKYPGEKPFHIGYAGTDLDDADSDGDGVRDGADDQDHDDIPNLMELSRKQATGRPFDPKTTTAATAVATPPHGRVNPFNPCLPDPDSRTCPIFVPFSNAWAPFDDSPNYLVLN